MYHFKQLNQLETQLRRLLRQKGGNRLHEIKLKNMLNSLVKQTLKQQKTPVYPIPDITLLETPHD